MFANPGDIEVLHGKLFYKEIRGVNYAHLKVAIDSLETKGYITLEWIDFDRFFSYITPAGEAYLDKWLMELQLP